MHWHLANRRIKSGTNRTTHTPGGLYPAEEIPYDSSFVKKRHSTTYIIAKQVVIVRGFQTINLTQAFLISYSFKF